MSKKLFTLLQALFLLGGMATAYAGDMTLDVYQNGVNVGTMTIPSSQYPNVVGRVNGTGITVRPQPRPAAQLAAQQKMAAWNQDFDKRHEAAVAQQEKWKQQFDQRHADAQKGYDHWKATR